MAALVQLDVPVPSYSVTAAETARALLERLQQRRLPRDLARLRFLPYKKNCNSSAGFGKVVFFLSVMFFSYVWQCNYT